MSYDLAKTQFIFGEYSTVKAYRRRRKMALFQEDKPLRLIEWSDWLRLKKAYPREVESDKLAVRTVWVLEEIAA